MPKVKLHLRGGVDPKRESPPLGRSCLVKGILISMGGSFGHPFVISVCTPEMN